MYKQSNITSFFKIKEKEYINIYTDGACSNNGKPYAKASIGIYFGDNDPRNVSQRVQGKQTNNIAELTAIKNVYNLIQEEILRKENVKIFTDSKYSMLCLTSYGAKCAKKNWSENIPNKYLVKETYELYKNLPNIKFEHIKAHTKNTDKHSRGNYWADKLATDALHP
jgi:ribonuclease HI